MATRRTAGDGMVRKREDGRWEGRIVIGHKENGEPLFRHVYAKTQKALLDKLHQNIECYRDVELTEDCLLYTSAGEIQNLRAVRQSRDQLRQRAGRCIYLPSQRR